ncbi:dihydrofolate reductase family protein [Cyclobacterium qasimii]|uniref:Dihydrofolate reductase n=2 Tax=Cyclobacterium qasimii TaxID=1350429 RepID=S7VI39_9BACT|nr:dihydrofolate reductase family protein [Cyclobacterium qasimii]EPR69641.1 Dihydrofolate reductase [Cyclobacterium qasimii M12-11B]GEO21473.1 dihydrofolate reductase [Cyclobacterium qasimii]
MKKLIYYVAISIDGFISGPNDDIGLFLSEGEGVTKYQEDLMKFNTVIMGRKTYEFGYKYGLKPGQAPYPHMEHYIFSNNLQIPGLASNVHLSKVEIKNVKDVISNSDTDVYLCGGGQFAGWLLDNGLINQVKLKVNPIVLGQGKSLFGESKTAAKLKLVSTESFQEGLQILTYDLSI